MSRFVIPPNKRVDLYALTGFAPGTALLITRLTNTNVGVVLTAEEPKTVGDVFNLRYRSTGYLSGNVPGCWVLSGTRSNTVLEVTPATSLDELDSTKYLIGTDKANVVAPVSEPVRSIAKRGLTVKAGQLLLDGVYCRELGVNAYSLITDIALGVSPTGYRQALDDLDELGVRLVRISVTPYDAANYTATLFGGGPTVIPTKWSDLAPGYRDAVKSVMDYAAVRGIYVLPNLIWQWKAIADLFSENYTLAFSNQWSKTRTFIRAFVSCFMQEYANHPAIGGYVAGCEFPLRGQNSTVASDVIATLAAIAKIVRAYDPDRAIFSGNANFAYDGNTIRPSFTDEIQKLLDSNPEPFDTVDTHVYSDIAYMSYDPANGKNKPALGAYEYLQRFIERNRYEAAQTGRPFVLTECGVMAYDSNSQTGQEIVGQTVKLRKMLQALYDSGVQLAMLWNYGSNTPAVQRQWNFAKGTALGNAYLPVIRNYINRFRSQPIATVGNRWFDPAAMGYPKPAGCMTIGTAQVGRNIAYPANPALHGNAGTLLLWLKIPAANGSYTRIIDAPSWDGTSTNGGFSLVFMADGLEPYIALAKVDGTEATNSAGYQPKLVPGEWSMRGYRWDGSSKVDTFVDGFILGTRSTGYAHAGKSRGGMWFGTGRNGASPFAGSIAGFVYCNRACTVEEIADYYNLGKYPTGALVIPFAGDGSAIGANAYAPTTVASGIVFDGTGLY